MKNLDPFQLLPDLFYYPASRNHHALCMMRDHHIRFVNSKGNIWTEEGVFNISSSDYQFVVSNQTAHLLYPQPGDTISILHADGETRSTLVLPKAGSADPDDEPVCDEEDLYADTTIILFRSGLPFFTPEIIKGEDRNADH